MLSFAGRAVGHVGRAGVRGSIRFGSNVACVAKTSDKVGCEAFKPRMIHAISHCGSKKDASFTQPCT